MFTVFVLITATSIGYGYDARFVFRLRQSYSMITSPFAVTDTGFVALAVTDSPA